MALNVDLRQLAIDRGSETPRPRRRYLMTRYVLPAAVLLGFVSLFAWALRDRFLPARAVTVLPVIVTRAEVREAGQPLFQAPGWVEPRPRPMLVSALASGVIEEIFAVEGQPIEAGQPVGRLIDVDARLALEQAQAELALREAELASVRAELEAARATLDRPLHLEAALAEADSRLAEAEGELAALPFEIQAAEARERFTRQELQRRQAAGQAIAGRLLLESRNALETATAELGRHRQRKTLLEREIEALRRKRTALEQQRAWKIEERQAVAEAEARLQAATARTRQATLAVEAAQRQLERMVIRAPRAGRVLEVVAQPGQHVTGLGSDSARDASPILRLYDPAMLQVRADVRLADVPLVVSGQPVRIETASVSGPLEGRVLLATGQANVQKNTLEVKVAMTDPPAAVRPEMLVQVTFLAPENPQRDSEEPKTEERLLIAKQLVEGTSPETFVWVADAGNVARRRPIKLGQAATGELVEVVEGLKVTDKLIANVQGLSDGERIKIVGEDARIGLTAGE